MNLNFNICFEQLYDRAGLVEVDKCFLNFLGEVDSGLQAEILNVRRGGVINKESDLIIKLAPVLDDFISILFRIESEVEQLSQLHNDLAAIFKCKRNFIQRRVAKEYKTLEDLGAPDITNIIYILREFGADISDELQFSHKILGWQADKQHEQLQQAKIYCAWVLLTNEGRKKHQDHVLFKLPKKLDYEHLIPELDKSGNKYTAPPEALRERKGFEHNDPGINLKQALDNTHYCLYCHERDKDSCSKGMKEKEGEYKDNVLGVELTGCPLDEKISEMNFLKTEGCIIGSLATAMIDNPMIASTGYRICNDCMKACIYQKQDPVDIPLAETQTLNDVLKLPYGFEIYSLLSRWNPLKFQNYLPKAIKSTRALVVGLGPAGFTMAHYLLNEGFTVVGIDGLKIEPIDTEISGIDAKGERKAFKPIKDIKRIYSPLEDREAKGFGGVVEYGITVRWDKNYLTVIRLLLERRENFRMYGGVRFGGAIDYHSARALGFSHIALALGAGSPNLPKIDNLMSKGVRTASDFLMSLQLSGAARKDSLSNLQIRLPIVVIGAGLTAVDTATESLAYYPVQVEKFLQYYEDIGDEIFTAMDEEELSIAGEFIKHARELRAYPHKKRDLLHKWGGAKMIYRKTLSQSPSYRLNYEELEKALEEGVEFIENIEPQAIELNQYGSCKGVVHRSGFIEAGSVFIATGTKPNTVLSKEDNELYKTQDQFFQLGWQPNSRKRKFLYKEQDDSGPGISILGDLHPNFAGSVVKAMASAKNAYQAVARDLMRNKRELNPAAGFFKTMDSLLMATVRQVRRLTPNIVEIIIKSPAAAAQFRPGQFYRLHNFEANAKTVRGKKLAMEGVALTGAWVDRKQGLISTIALEIGGSSDLCARFGSGENIILAGPTGTPTTIPENETVLLVGGGLGNAVLFSIGRAMRENGCRVLYFAGYKREQDRYKIEELEKAGDVIVWCCDELELSKSRLKDKSIKGNIIDAMYIYDAMRFDEKIELCDVDRMLVIGSDKMMAAVTHARHNGLKHAFKDSHIAIGSINSPMQCMMKEICAQCLQKHHDPKTGKVSYVYSCFNQDQFLDCVDFQNLNDRLKQNSVQEKITATWLKKHVS